MDRLEAVDDALVDASIGEPEAADPELDPVPRREHPLGGRSDPRQHRDQRGRCRGTRSQRRVRRRLRDDRSKELLQDIIADPLERFLEEEVHEAPRVPVPAQRRLHP